VRAWVALGACVLAGLAGGAVWTWLQADRYRAEARVFVRPPSNRIVPAVEALAESSLVEANVAQTLRLSSPPHLSASAVKGGVVTVSVEADGRERARQIDAEAVVILTQKVAQRFGSVTATVLDPAHVSEQTSPTPGRNLLVTGLIGLVAGLGAAGVWWSRTRMMATAVADPAADRRLRARIDEVTKRERALAQGAGQLAAREMDLERREEELAAAASRPTASAHAAVRREQELERRERELDRQLAEREAQLDAREAELQAAASQAEPKQPGPAPLADLQTRRGWDLRALERLVQEQGTADPEASAEWSAYLFFLREHADHEGKLPSSFDPLIADVFGNLPGLLASRDAPGDL
jgi:hypothetical protein